MPYTRCKMFFKCHKKEHYSGLCLSKRRITSVSIVQTTEPAVNSDTDSDKNFLGTVESQQETQWITLLKVTMRKLSLKLTPVLKFQQLMKLPSKIFKICSIKEIHQITVWSCCDTINDNGKFTANSYL